MTVPDFVIFDRYENRVFEGKLVFIEDKLVVIECLDAHAAAGGREVL